jgi:hypothetical protein
MGTEPGDVTTAHKAKLDALVKDAEEAEEKAVAAPSDYPTSHKIMLHISPN